MTEILLDPSIRDWVLFPLVLIVILVGLLRHYATLLLNGKSKANIASVRNHNVTNYAGLLISAGEFITPEGFSARTQHLMQQDLKREAEVENPMDMSDPSVMMGMLKGQMMMMANNIGLMMLISFFLSGFVVARVPFGVPVRLREMMQRGIEIDDLECSYVTSLSFYFLANSGVNGIMQLVLGSDAEVNMMSGGMDQLQNNAMKQPTDFKKVWKQISEEMKFVQSHHKWTVTEAPARLVAEWKIQKRLQAHSAKK